MVFDDGLVSLFRETLSKRREVCSLKSIAVILAEICDSSTYDVALCRLFGFAGNEHDTRSLARSIHLPN